jgi:HEAT repeat protein
MQASEKGLAGNLIEDERLKQILTACMREEGFSEPREKAGKLIQQLRDRNFILCYRGADTYSFVHRTFLEYFCAKEIVNRFNKRGTEGGMTLEVLRDEIFGQHWQDETWHEVLQLICGLVDAKFAGELIEFLMGVEVDRSLFLVEKDWLKGRLKPEGLMNLLLAADCFSDVENSTALESLGNSVLVTLQREVEHQDIELSRDAVDELIDRIVRYFPNTLDWLKQRVQNDTHSEVRRSAVWAIASNYKEQPDTLDWLKQRVQNDTDSDVRRAAVFAIASNYKEQPDTLDWLKQRVQNDTDSDVRWAAVWAIASEYKEQRDTADWLKQQALSSIHENVRWAAVRALVHNYQAQPDTLDWLTQQGQQQTNLFMRLSAIWALSSYYKNESEVLLWLKENTLNWLKDIVQTNSDRRMRASAFQALSNIFDDDPNEQFFLLQCILSDSALRPEELQDKSTEEILEFLLEQNPEEAESILREVEQNYPDEAVRTWAQGRLVDS